EWLQGGRLGLRDRRPDCAEHRDRVLCRYTFSGDWPDDNRVDACLEQSLNMPCDFLAVPRQVSASRTHGRVLINDQSWPKPKQRLWNAQRQEADIRSW
ncbi:MAG TPA: hypothetical protein VIZ17_14050, partial [Acetobacteraceae bacterium]